MIRSARSHHLSDEDVVVYGDHDLDASRRARVEAHLRVCADCRERLAASDRISRILRSSLPVVGDPKAWQTFIDRARSEDERRRADRPRMAAWVGPLVLLLLLLASLWIQGAWQGGNEPTPLHHVATTQPGVDLLPFAATEPLRLPLGLTQVERSIPSSDRLELLYRNEAGLAILLAESPTDAVGPPVVPEGVAGQVTVVIRDTTVLVLNDPRPPAVAGLLWNRRGLRFELLVTEAPPAGLARLDAVRIVETLVAAQDAAA